MRIPRIYLAGKMLPSVRETIYESLKDVDVRLYSPLDKPKETAIGDFVGWDLNAIRYADAVIVIDNPALMKGTMAEVGFAYALKIPVVTVVMGRFIHPFLAYMSQLVTCDMEVLIEYIRKWVETGDWITAYYAVYDY